MKILIVSPKFHPIIGGGETFVLHKAQQLHANNHDVHLAVEPHPDRDISSYGFGVTEINGLSDNSLNILSATDGLYNLIKDFNPDIIHVHGYFAQLAISLANDNKPVITSIHSTPVWGERIIGGMSGFDQEKLFAQNILTKTKPSVVTAANDVYEVAAKKLSNGVVPVIVFPYPILDIFYQKHDASEFRNKFRLKDSDILLTLPSRIIERKGIKEAVDALALLPQNYYLCIPCASEPLDKKYWQVIKKSEAFLTNTDRILIPNTRILPEKMPLLYAASNMVIMPSYYEGAPVATVEAMASSRPFIGADAQGINGFIRNNENGLLVPMKDSHKLAQAIQKLGQDKELQLRLGKQAAKDAQRLSWKVQLPKLVKIYTDVIHAT